MQDHYADVVHRVASFAIGLGMECLACKRMHNANKEYSRRYRSRKADELREGK